MEILGIEKVSLVDYDGKICATIFTGGCNYRCPFCHNSPIVNKEFEEHNEDEILKYLQSRKTLLDAVTISGGEPTLQQNLVEFIIKIKQMGYLVKLDTNGTNPEMIENLLKKNLIDYVALDIKNNFDDYNVLTGVLNSQVDKVKTTLQILKDYKIQYELRTTLIGNFHFLKNIEEMSKDLKGEKLLFLQNFVDSGSCFAKNLNSVSKKQAEEYREILSKTIQNVILRGYN